MASAGNRPTSFVGQSYHKNNSSLSSSSSSSSSSSKGTLSLFFQSDCKSWQKKTNLIRWINTSKIAFKVRISTIFDKSFCFQIANSYISLRRNCNKNKTGIYPNLLWKPHLSCLYLNLIWGGNLELVSQKTLIKGN